MELESVPAESRERTPGNIFKWRCSAAWANERAECNVPRPFAMIDGIFNRREVVPPSAAGRAACQDTAKSVAGK